jgi:hypothetical protein
MLPLWIAKEVTKKTLRANDSRPAEAGLEAPRTPPPCGAPTPLDASSQFLRFLHAFVCRLANLRCGSPRRSRMQRALFDEPAGAGEELARCRLQAERTAGDEHKRRFFAHFFLKKV